MDSSIKKLLELSYAHAAIDRDLLYPNRERPENDAEHGFQLVLTAWHIIEKDKLPLDALKVFKLCLAHDLVEVYSGDVPLWGHTGHDEKEERERVALDKIRALFGSENDIADVIQEYKEKETEEAKFAYGMDKLLPFLNQLNSEGAIWKKHAVPLEKVLEKTSRFAEVSIHLVPYFEAAMQELKSNPDKYLKV